MSEMEREQPWRPNPLHGEFSIKKIYIKDTSFETPNSPKIFQANWAPDMDVHVHSHSSDLDAGEFEVVLMVTAVVSVAGEDGISRRSRGRRYFRHHRTYIG